jgi:hypothetical protein
MDGDGIRFAGFAVRCNIKLVGDQHIAGSAGLRAVDKDCAVCIKAVKTQNDILP